MHLVGLYTHNRYSPYLDRRSNHALSEYRVQVRNITAWADFLGELVMGTMFAVSTEQSHLISVPDACRMAEDRAAYKV